MSEYSTVKVEGLKELGDALRSLPPKVAKNVARGAVQAAAAVFRDEAKVRAPVFTGNVADGHPPPGTLKRSIVTKHIPEKSGPLLQTSYVHVRQGAQYQKQGRQGNLSQDAYYWHFVEFGTANMPAKPFLRPAFEVEKEGALLAFQSYLGARLPAEVDKLKVFGLRMT